MFFEPSFSHAPSVKTLAVRDACIDVNCKSLSGKRIFDEVFPPVASAEADLGGHDVGASSGSAEWRDFSRVRFQA